MIDIQEKIELINLNTFPIPFNETKTKKQKQKQEQQKQNKKTHIDQYQSELIFKIDPRQICIIDSGLKKYKINKQINK